METRQIFLNSIVLTIVSCIGHYHDQFRHTHIDCAVMQHRGRAWKTRKGNGFGVEKKAKPHKLKQMLGDPSAVLLEIASPVSIEPIDEDAFGGLL